MSLSSDEQARLDKLRTARDRLISGTNTVSVSTDYGSVTYGQGDLALLDREIQQLEAKASTTGVQRGAIRFRIR